MDGGKERTRCSGALRLKPASAPQANESAAISAVVTGVGGVRAKYLAVWCQSGFALVWTCGHVPLAASASPPHPVVCDTRLELGAHSTYLFRRLACGSLVVEEVLLDDDMNS